MKLEIGKVYEHTWPATFNGVNIDKTLRTGPAACFIISSQLASVFDLIPAFVEDNRGTCFTDMEGNIYQLRTLTWSGVSLNPAKQIGFGRCYDRDEHANRLETINYWIIVDIANAPDYRLLVFPTAIFGTKAHVSRDDVLPFFNCPFLF
jgi:hypothetical protein